MQGTFQTFPLKTARSRVSTATPASTTKVQGIILVKLKFASFPSKRDGYSRSWEPGLFYNCLSRAQFALKIWKMPLNLLITRVLHQRNNIIDLKETSRRNLFVDCRPRMNKELDATDQSSSISTGLKKSTYPKMLNLFIHRVI